MEPVGGDPASPAARDGSPPRLRRVDRSQVRMLACSLDELLPDDHRARLVWRVIQTLDLGAFDAAVMARGSEPGRAATDPRILVALWLYAAIEGVGSGREVDRLCDCHDAYRWLAGGVSLNYHTINDFRVTHEAALDDLFTQVIATLVKQDLIDVTRVAQDGVRVRAGAGASSFRSASSLERLRDDARSHLASLKRQNDPSLSAQQHAKRLSDARDREARLNAALAQLPVQQSAQAKAAKRSGLSKPRETRVSTTDPDARKMKVADGGYRPAYNVQLACDPRSRAIVGVDVSQRGSDSGLDQPMREQVERRTGQRVAEHLMDGGYASLDAIDQTERAGVTVYAPVKQPRACDRDKGIDRHARKPKDTDHTFAWRKRMTLDASQTIYRERASTIETINADLTEHRGLRQFPVRGSPKVRTIALWLALAYNILHFGTALLDAAQKSC